MMNSIIMLKGKVKYTLTLDPSVWIFDDRKLDMDVFFEHPPEQKDETEAYTKAVSKHWDREIQEGAVFPPTLKPKRNSKTGASKWNIWDFICTFSSKRFTY